MIYGKRGAWIWGACALGVLLSFVQVSATAPTDIRVNAMKSVFDADAANIGDPHPSIVAAGMLRATRHAPIYRRVQNEGALLAHRDDGERRISRYSILCRVTHSADRAFVFTTLSCSGVFLMACGARKGWMRTRTG